MEIMLVGGLSPMMRKLSLKLHKEGHKVYALTGNRNPSDRYEHIFERYDFPYSAASVEEVFRSVNPDVTILLGAFDGNLGKKDSKREAVEYAAGLQNILLSWAALNKGRLIYLSSVEVYGSSYQIPVTEEVMPKPEKIREIMLLGGEESCRFYQEQLKRDVLILRLDRMYDIPKDRHEATLGICENMCLEAFQSGKVSYRNNYRYGLTYMGDAVDSIYKLVICEKHMYDTYNISSGESYCEQQIANAIGENLSKEPEKINNTLDDYNSVILSNQRFKEEFGFEIDYSPEEIIQKTLRYMKMHSSRFLDPLHPGVDIWHRIYFKALNMLGAWFPYVENLVLFIPFFMLNNRATESLYFSKIDFYLIYVLLFAVVHGQRQATFSALLATAGYIFRQMYSQSGITVMTDYNTYVWISEIFIVGLVVGYLKDRLNFLQEEKEQEVDFLSERVTDITDIHDSNLRVKEGLITQVVNYDYSLGTVYNMIEQLGEDHPTKILFRALTLLKNVMECRDISIYLIDQDHNAQLFGYTSARSASMGHTVYLPEKEPFFEAFSRNIVYLNRNMDSQYPMMAYCVREEEKPNIMIMLWSIPFERMTIEDSNRLIVFGKIISKTVKRTENYLGLLQDEHYLDNSCVLKVEAFEELVNTYRESAKRNVADYSLIKVLSVKAITEKIGLISEMLSLTDYMGYGNNGNLYILLTCTDEQECTSFIRSLKQKKIQAVISEGIGL